MFSSVCLVLKFFELFGDAGCVHFDTGGIRSVRQLLNALCAFFFFVFFVPS